MSMRDPERDTSPLTVEQQQRLALENVRRCQEQRALGLFDYPGGPPPSPGNVARSALYWQRRVHWEKTTGRWPIQNSTAS